MVEGGGSVTRGPGGFGGLFLPFAAIAILIYVADQASKLLIVTNLRPYESIPESGLIRLTYVTNSGSAFGLLQGQTMFLILVSIIGVMGVLFYYRANGRESALLRYSLALLLGGALGNLTDRLIRGAVVDFISVQMWGDFYFPTFNVADSALSVGLFALSIYVLRHRAKEKRDELERIAAENVPSTLTLPHQGEGNDSVALSHQAEGDDLTGMVDASGIEGVGNPTADEGGNEGAEERPANGADPRLRGGDEWERG